MCRAGLGREVTDGCDGSKTVAVFYVFVNRADSRCMLAKTIEQTTGETIDENVPASAAARHAIDRDDDDSERGQEADGKSSSLRGSIGPTD